MPSSMSSKSTVVTALSMRWSMAFSTLAPYASSSRCTSSEQTHVLAASVGSPLDGAYRHHRPAIGRCHEDVVGSARASLASSWTAVQTATPASGLQSCLPSMSSKPTVVGGGGSG